MRINQAKLELVPVGNVFNAKGVARILGYKVSSLPMKYHCLPFGASFKAKSIWDDVIERIEHCLASQKKDGQKVENHSY